MKKYLRTLAYVVALSLCFAFILTGCTKTGDTTDDAANTDAGTEAQGTEETLPAEVAITMWHNFGADVEAPYFDGTILGMFHEAYPYIAVNVVDQGNDQYRELIATNFATGTTPDVARIDSTQIASFANQDMLVALDQFDGYEEAAVNLFPGVVAMTLFKGQHYAFPVDTNCKAAVCDMDVLGELGFSAPPETMEELIDACLSKKPGEYMINVSGTGDWDFYPYLWLFGGEVTDPGYTTAQGYINGPDTIAAVTKLKEIHDEGVFTIRDIDGTTDAWEGIQSDQYAMFFEGPWFYPCIPGWQDMNIVPALIPSYDGKSASVAGGQSIAMFSTSENQKAAFALMEFLVSADIQLSMYEGMNTIPVNTIAASDERLTSDEILGVYLEQLNTAKSRIPSPYDAEIAEAVGDEINAIFYDEISVEEGLNRLAERIDEILNRE